MKRFIFAVCFLAACVSASAKSNLDLPDYKFTVDKENPVTSVKNQYRSGTCWAFSTISFIESEIIRINRIKDAADYPDLSEFFIVSHSYMDRARKYVMLDGKMGFSAGSESADVIDVIRDYGIVPQSEMSGMNYGTELPVQAELDAVLRGYVDAVAKNPNKTLTTAWQPGFQGILDAYFGKCPETFTVNGKEYSPKSYAESLKFNPEDYVSLTSFTHHPFYTAFPIEVCDNWRWDSSYNVPVEELMETIDSALNNGYTIAWGGDVSQDGFTRNGLGVLLAKESAETKDSDQSRWVGNADGAEKAPAVKVTEKEATQETRQFEFENKTVTDDHGMHIYGIAHNEDGGKFYVVKNSWGVTGKYDGIWYMSEAFIKQQTISILVHKSALSSGLRKKLGIK